MTETTERQTHRYKIGDLVYGEEGAHRTTGVIVGHDVRGRDDRPYCGYHDGQDCPGPFYSVDVGGDFGVSSYAEHELTRDDRLTELARRADRHVGTHDETNVDEATCVACGRHGIGWVEVDHRPFVCTCSDQTRPSGADPCQEVVQSVICDACNDMFRQMLLVGFP